MNILFLTNHLNIGGITSYVLSLGRGLKQRGDNVYIASSGGQLDSRFIQEGIHFIHIPIRTKSEISPKILFSFNKLRPLIREKNIDILHANTRVTSVLAAWLSRASGIPYILTCHGFFKPKLWRRIFPLWGKLTIAISAKVREHLIGDFHLRVEKIRLIYNGVDLEKIKIYPQEEKLRIRQEIGLRGSPCVGIVARLSDIKGHQYLIEAMSYVIRELPNAQLLIVGDGREKNNLQKKVIELGIQKNTVFIPSVEDTQTVLHAIEIFVMPSLQEGLGLSIMEAMAQGLAVIASDIGGIRDLIQDGVNGRLVRPKDVQALYKAILELLKNKDKARLLGRNAARTIEDNFSLKKMVSQTKKAYQECLSAKS